MNDASRAGLRARHRAARAAAALAIALPLCVPGGCAGAGKPQAAVQGDAPAGQAPGTVRTRIAQGQTGLEVVTWQVVDDRRFDEALRAHEVPSIGALDALALRRNGFVTASVPVARLDALRDALGGSAMDVHLWLGSSPHWRELAAVRVGDLMVEVECRDADEIRAAIGAGAHSLLLDNMPVDTLRAVPRLAQTLEG